MKFLNRAVAVGMVSTAMFGIGAGASFAAGPYTRVMLISVDGLHAIDLENYVATHPSGALAALAKTGIRYSSAMTPVPSDSFPGTLALVTGGTPRSTGVFYDDGYDRSYFAPGSDCSGAPGAEVSFAENIDVDSDKIDAGGVPGKWQTQIDPKKLPMTLVNGKCVAVYPHSFSRVNNVFEIVKAHGGHTSWSDKHPAYELLNGPSGTGLDEFYALEQDSLIPGTKKATTASYKSERDFDEARVKALLNEINGMDVTGSVKMALPELFGMNFQAVSVGQKLPKSGPGDDSGLVGGYLDAKGTPNSGLAKQLDYVDGGIGELIAALKSNGLLDTTLIIVTAKHGQSPIDPLAFQAMDDDPYSKTPGYGFHIADDASLLWLAPKTRTANVDAALSYLETNRKLLGIGKIWTPNQMAAIYNDPATDSRTPDFFVTVNPGVVYTSGKKIAEHGGSNIDDVNVALLLSNPGIKAASIGGLVQTTQVAPTILKALGLDPNELQAVKKEGTQALPALPF
jgi:hypothetical protein